MTQIKKITDKQGNDIYLRTHTKAVVDDNGYTAESRLQAMQDEINAKQMELGAVPSDLVPTEGSSNWVTSGGLFNQLNLSSYPVPIDLSQYEAVRAYPNPTKWMVTNESYPYYGKFIPIIAGQKYRIISNATYSSYYGFLTTNTYSHNADVSYATGCTRVSLPKDAIATEIAPNDARYLYIATYTTVDIVPQGVYSFAKTTIREKLENTDITPVFESDNLITSDGVYKSTHTTTTPSSLDLIQYDYVDLWMISNNTWNTTYTGKFIPVKPNRNYIITAHAENDSYCCMVTNNNSSALPAVGSSRVTVTAGESVNLVAPNNAMFLWVSGTASVDRLPQSVFEFECVPVVSAVEAYKEMPKSIFLEDVQTINMGPTGDGFWYTNSNKWFGKIIYIKGYKKVYMLGGAYGTKYCMLTKGGYSYRENVSYSTGYSGTGHTLLANTAEIVDVPNDAEYLYFFVTFDNYAYNCEPAKIVLLNNLIGREELNLVAENASTTPTYIEFGENERVMYTVDNFIMKSIFENDVEFLYFSTDLGKNWIQIENTFDTKITHVHYFLDGTLLMCTPTKCYWTKDFQTFTESTVYDYDGSIFQPTSGTRFYTIPKYKEKRTIVNNEEWHLWGDYIITTTKPRLWYTKDNGRTIHAAYAFGLSNIDGTVYDARHIHAFEYNPYDGYFYAFTGDSSTECHIIKGQYDNDTWNWEHIATGALWKLTSPVFFNGYFAAVTDYTDSSLAEKKGLVRCPTNAITEDNICYLFNATSSMMGNAALSGYLYDRNGWRVMTCDYRGENKVLVAKNNYNFTWVNNTNGKKMNSFIGPNANGDVYVTYGNVGSSVSGEDWLKMNVNSFNFTKAMRDAGAKDFFNYRITDF